jgi:hypothetical protein
MRKTVLVNAVIGKCRVSASTGTLHDGLGSLRLLSKRHERRRLNLENKSTPNRRSKQEHRLYAVMGQELAGNAIALIIAPTEADAECYALLELGFLTLSKTSLISDSVHVGPADTER